MVINEENNLFFRTSHISKSFPGVKALKDVSINISPGEIHSIIGENGAGKSTLMNVFMGIYQPEDGVIIYQGKEVIINSPIEAQKLGLGIVPQELNLVPQMSVTENILLGMFPVNRMGTIDRKKQSRIAEQAIAKLDDRIDINAKVHSLSSAQQQIVQIARALAFGAKIIIFDEPTACLTLKETEKLFSIIASLREQGAAIFYISHRMEEILNLSDRISVFRDGKYVAELDPKEVTIEEMVNYMVGREVENKIIPRSYNRTEHEIVLDVKGYTREGEFEDINFSLHKGEILGFSGLVGAGRTELAKSLYGFTHPDSGVITLFGKKVYHKHPIEAINNKVAYIPEERRQEGIFPLLDISENMVMPILKRFMRFIKLNRKDISENVNDFIEKLSIKTSSEQQQIKNLSGGNQQKVIISRWILSGSKIMILDEPTRGIDVHAKSEIHRLLRDLTDKGISIILISSEMEEVLNLSDRIMIMHEGRKKGELLNNEATQEKLLQMALR